MHLPSHGANPEHLSKELKLSLPQGFIDFSVNTTPFPLQEQVVENWQKYLECVMKYPDPHSEKLKTVIAKKEGVSTDQLLVGNGAAQLIFLLAMYFRNKKVLIVEPTFSEYRDASRAFSCDIAEVILEKPWELNVAKVIEEAKGKDVLFICNPNNPTGVSYRVDDLLTIFKQLKSEPVRIIIDEAFYDFREDAPSILSYLKDFPHLIILRSLTKMYGIAGIRLGYMAANKQFIEQIAPLQNPWSVNGLAQQLGVDCLEDSEYVRNVQIEIAKERNRIFPLMEKMGYELSNSEVNFYLLREKDQEKDLLPFIQFLIENKIVPRHTYNFPTLDGKYIRLAIKSKADNDQLLKVLKRWKER